MIQVGHKAVPDLELFGKWLSFFQIDALDLAARAADQVDVGPMHAQQLVAMLTIPFGRTASYQDIANAIGKPQAVRAVGAANGQNPLSIIVPCHRVIGSQGALVGYGGGLWRKEWLLRHEGSLLL